MPRVRNGESWMSVEVPPLFVTSQIFCEYCAVAKARPAMHAAPRRHAETIVGRGLVSARGSMLLGCDTAILIRAFGRVQPGLTLEQAQNRLTGMSAPAMQATLPAELPARVRPQYLKQRFVLQPAASGVSYIRTTLKPPVAILSALVLLLLLLASFTVAESPAGTRLRPSKEIAVRIALGASRNRIIRQLALEGFGLAFAGAGAGLLLSRALAVLLVRVSSSAFDPLVLDLSLDWACSIHMLSATLSAILSFGFAAIAAHIAPADAFKAG